MLKEVRMLVIGTAVATLMSFDGTGGATTCIALGVDVYAGAGECWLLACTCCEGVEEFRAVKSDDGRTGPGFVGLGLACDAPQVQPLDWLGWP